MKAIRSIPFLLGFLCVGVQGVRAVQPAPPDAPRQVTIEMYLVDLVEIDGSEQTFFADVFIAATWRDSTLASPGAGVRTVPRSDVWSPTLLIVNERDVSSSLPDVVQIDAAGNVQHSMRLTGDFSARMDLRDFPRDHQRFNIWVVAPPLGGVVVDLIPSASIARLRADTLSISDWNLGEFGLVEREYSATPRANVVSGVSLFFEADRKLGYYIIQVLLPVTAVVLMAWAVFWIDPGIVPTRVGVVVTTMLTLIAYRFMLGDLVPRLSYLTRLDYYLLWSTTLVVMTLGAMAATNFMKVRERDDLVRIVDWTGRAGYPLVMGLLTLIVWVL
ncbi:MAG: hypothetical protein ACC682_13990 [Gemmatimonadota bacterium]